MAKLGGKGAWVAAGVALLVGLAVVPALSGAANAAPVAPAATTSTTSPWAYGGEGWSNGSVTIGNATLDWNSTFGWTVIFSVTPGASAGVWTLEEQRTLGITISASLTTPRVSDSYQYHGQEVDLAFANVTNQSTVYANGQPVPALGIVNASVAANGLIDESLRVSGGGVTHTESLHVTAVAQGSTSFTPSLGLIPLNLTGVSTWNSSAEASPSASWNVSYAFTGLNGSSLSGSQSGSLSAMAPVSVTGAKIVVVHPFSDHQVRVGVVLIVQGPFDCYDGFILVPHAFDLFGSAAHGYSSMQFGSAGVTAENLYLTPGPDGFAVTAADQTFASADTSVNALAGPSDSIPAASAPNSPGSTVEGQPMSVSQAHAIDRALTATPGASSPALSGLLVAGLVGLVVVAVVGTIGVIEWRSYARRRSKGGLVGGYGESWPNGVPPASAVPPGTYPPSGPQSGPGSAEDPSRRL